DNLVGTGSDRQARAEVRAPRFPTPRNGFAGRLLLGLRGRADRIARRAAGLSNLRAPFACAAVCGSGAPLRPFRAPGAPKASRNCGAASFPGTPLRVAFSFSRL